MTARALTTEEEGRYRTILAGRGRDWNQRDWTSLDIAALLATLDREREATAAAEQRLRDALRDANQIIAMTRQHLHDDHPDCAYEALGVMNDAARAALLDSDTPASPRQGEPQAALASDPASPSEPAISLHQGAASPPLDSPEKTT